MLGISQKSKRLQEVEKFTFENCVLPKDRNFASDFSLNKKFAMTDSDIESDEDFQETLSYFEDDLLNQPQDGVVQWSAWSYEKLILDVLTSQIASGRVDRVESVLLLVMRFHQEEYFSQALVDDVIYHAMSKAASRGSRGVIQMICRITAGYDISIAEQHAAIRILLFRSNNPSCVEALRDLGFNEGFSQVFDLIKNGVARQVFGRYRTTPSRSFTIRQWNFFLAALSGDLEEVKRALDDQQINLHQVLDVHACSKNTEWFPHVLNCSPALCAAAARGHWKVVKAILAKFAEAERMGTACGLSRPNGPCAPLPWNSYIDCFRTSVVIIAGQSSDVSVFSEKFPELENAISNVFFAFSFVHRS